MPSFTVHALNFTKNMPASFQSLLDASTEDTGLSFPPEWAQGRATFGGLIAATALKSMRRKLSPERHPRALQILFAAPVAPGEAEVRTRVIREGKSASTVESSIVQGDQTCAVILGSFGADRESSIRVDAPVRPEAQSPEASNELPFIQDVTPEFTRFFSYRYAVGGFPFSGSKEGVMGGWCRFRDESVKVSHEHILGLVDAWPPSVLPMLTTPAPGSSLTWTIQFLQWTPAALTDGWWFYRAETDAAANGYAASRAILWDPDGNPAALSSQAVAVFG